MRLMLAANMLCGIFLLSADAGTKKPPSKEPPPPQTPVEKFVAKIRELDPQRVLVSSARVWDRPEELWITVTSTFHRAHYQDRLQLAQAFAGAWRTLCGYDQSRIFVVDGMNNIVGAGGRPSSVWVQKP